VLIVARSILRSRCDGVRPRRIVQHLQGFGLGPLVGRLVEEIIRLKRNRQRHKCEDAKGREERFDTTEKRKKRMGAWGQLLTPMRFGAIIRDRPRPVNSQPFGVSAIRRKGVLTNLLWLLYPERSVYCAWRVR
jgi:hypothetical protein